MVSSTVFGLGCSLDAIIHFRMNSEPCLIQLGLQGGLSGSSSSSESSSVKSRISVGFHGECSERFFDECIHHLHISKPKIGGVSKVSLKTDKNMHEHYLHLPDVFDILF